MARIARLVVPNFPHHITQRGSRRQKTFFCREDYQYYLELMRQSKGNAGVRIWAYCLMPNHVHLVAVPKTAESLARFLRTLNRAYAMKINQRMGWKGHLWQERFHSFVMDERHLYAAVRYVELNPVRAKLCDAAENWRWSSARAHMLGCGDGNVEAQPMLDRVGDWRSYLQHEVPDSLERSIRGHTRTGRPAGSNEFIEQLERLTGRALKRQKPGPRPRK